MNPKISFVMITARANYPYLGRPDLHLFEPTLHSLKTQTMENWGEWVIVDVLYNQRKDYFKNMDLPFQVKHVPAKPNLWIEKGLPGICTQYNKGIIYSDGELIFFTGDSHMMFPNFMERMWIRYLKGYFPLAWYFFDNSFANGQPIDSDKEKFNIAYPAQTSKAPVSYNILGYSGKNVSIEHRYVETFGANTQREMFPAPWLWWFGCSSASLESMLKINGFDQKFDGDRMLLDCDVGSRLELAGYGPQLALFRDVFLIRAATNIGIWNPSLHKDKITIKCNYPLIWFSRAFNHPKANTYKLGDKEINWIKTEWCAKYCPIRELCKTEHPWQYPFEHKEGYSGHNSSKEWFNFWKENQSIIDLSEEREKRLNEEKYVEGTFVWGK